ncbi:MAG: hypothetical protein R2699_13985 [Acidimicrobiales bacterium]
MTKRWHHRQRGLDQRALRRADDRRLQQDQGGAAAPRPDGAQLAPDVRVNAVAPGLVRETDMAPRPVETGWKMRSPGTRRWGGSTSNDLARR